MMNPIQCLKNNINELNNEYWVSKIGIFGSFAREEANESSDVDILVEFSRSVDLFHFIGLQNRLAEMLGREVDLTTPKALKPLIKDQILKEVVYI